MKKLQTAYDSGKYQGGKQEVLREFLFSCYTSLSYAEFSDVTNDNLKPIQLKSKGTFLLLCNERTKTNIMYKIPIVSPVVVNLLGNSESLEKIFNPLSNQLTNRYLKEIMRDLEINKTMTFHRARHSFRTLAAKKVSGMVLLRVLWDILKEMISKIFISICTMKILNRKCSTNRW